MLRGLPGIQQQVSVCQMTLAWRASPISTLAWSFRLLDGFTKLHSQVRLQRHVLHMVHLAYLDEMQQCKCMNAWKCHRRCITRKQARQAQGQDSMAHKFNLSQAIVGMQVISRLSNQFKVHSQNADNTIEGNCFSHKQRSRRPIKVIQDFIES